MCWGSNKSKTPTKWEVRSETPSYLNPDHLKSEPVPQLSYLALVLDTRGGRRWGQKASPIIGKHSWLSVLFRSRIHSTHVDWKIWKLIIQFKVVSGWTTNQVPGRMQSSLEDCILNPGLKEFFQIEYLQLGIYSENTKHTRKETTMNESH